MDVLERRNIYASHYLEREEKAGKRYAQLRGNFFVST